MNQPILQMDLRLLGGAVAVLGLAIGVIWWVGRRVRDELGPARPANGAREPLRASPPVPPQVATMLQRGLVTPAQLASMTDAERQLFFATLASADDDEATPGAAARRPSARVLVRPGDLPVLYCPACGYRVERFSSSPPITGQCETCGARIVVRRDGPRLLLTVVPKE